MAMKRPRARKKKGEAALAEPPVENFGPHAPISEALIDFRTTLPAATTVDALRSLHSQIRSEYPNERPRRRLETRIEFQESGGTSRSENFGTVGWVFASPDGRNLIQFRLDGFTANRLPPYESWDALQAEARRVWPIFRDGANPDLIQRVSVRYINRFRLPIGVDLDRYFTAGPRIPPGLPQTLQGFLVQLVIPDQSINATAVVSHAHEVTSDPERVSVILDVEVSREQPINAQSEMVWDSLDSLRVFKNRIFFSYITDETKALIRAGKVN